MKSFRIWLEGNRDETKEALLAALSLTKDDLGTPLASLDPVEMLRQLSNLGLWNSLPSYARNTVTSVIKSQIGNVESLLEKLTDLSFGTSGVQPPIK